MLTCTPIDLSCLDVEGVLSTNMLTNRPLCLGVEGVLNDDMHAMYVCVSLITHTFCIPRKKIMWCWHTKHVLSSGWKWGPAKLFNMNILDYTEE